MLVHYLLNMQRWYAKILGRKVSLLKIAALYKVLRLPQNFQLTLTTFFFVELAPTFAASPPDPFHVVEGNNITLMWHYNLDGSFDDVVFQFIGSTSILTIVDKFDIDRDAAVPESVYQGRVREKINATQAEITIFALQRSESGVYEIELINSNRLRVRDRVTVQVQCKLTIIC